MSIQFGDILQHNNPYYPITDVTDVKGGLRIIATFSNIDLYNAFNNIPEKLKQNYSTLLITTTNKYYYLSGTDSTITTSWTSINSGFSGSGTTNSVTKWLGQSILGDSIMTDNGDTITINGNLLITGTTSTVNSENLIVKDPIILLAGAQSGTPSFDSGFFVNRGTGATQAFIWDESSNEFSFFSTTSSSTTLGNVSIGTYSNVRTGALSVGTGVTSSRFSVSSIGGTLSLVVNEQGDTIFSGDTRVIGNTFSNLPTGSITFGSKTAIYSPNDAEIVIGADRLATYNYNYGWKFNRYQITNQWGNPIEVQNTIGTIGNLWIGSSYVLAGYGFPSSQQSTLFVKATLPSIMRVVGTGATWSNSASIFEINNSGAISIGTSQSMSGSKLFIQSGTSSSTIGSNVMLDLYNPDTVGLGSQVSEIAFSADTSGGVNAYNTQHRYAVISGYANTWNNVVTGGGIKFSTRNGTSGSLVTALVVAPNGSVYNASRGSNTLYGLDALLVSTGINNVAIGQSAMQNNLGGVNNTAVGMSSMASNLSGNYNTVVGCQALVGNILGSDNTAIGIASQQLATQSSGNTSVGRASLYNNLSSNSVAIGLYALTNNTIGTNNTAIGFNSLYNNTTTVTTIDIIDGGSGYTQSSTFSNVQLSYISGSTALTYPVVTIYVGSGGTVSTATLVTNGAGFKDTTTVMGSNLGAGFTFSVKVNTSGLLSGNGNVALGYQSLYSNTSGGFNTAIGYQSLYVNKTGIFNTAIGYQSLYATTAPNNTAIGFLSMTNNTSGNGNVAIGREALTNNTTAGGSVAIGLQALMYNNADFNIAIGAYAMGSNINGYQNIAIGAAALGGTSSVCNIAIGYESLTSNSDGVNNTALGFRTLFRNTTGFDNTALGVISLHLNTTGSSNSGLGLQSLYANTTGSYNTALGTLALVGNTIGSYNTSVGMYSQTNGTNSNYNTSVGYNSLRNNLSSNSVAVGNDTLYYNTIGPYNTALGFNSLYNNTTTAGLLDIIDSGSGYTASSTFSNVQLSYISGSTALTYPVVTVYVGSTGSVSTITLSTTFSGVGFVDTTTVMGANLGTGFTFSVKISSFGGLKSGERNTAIGYQSLYTNTSGYYNTAVGAYSLFLNKTGRWNTTLGDSSLYNNTTGSGNVAVGYNSLHDNTTGSANIAIGQLSLYSNTTSQFNIAIGETALYSNNGSFNTAIGSSSLSSNISGTNNTAVGYLASQNTTGSHNTTLGRNSLYNNTVGSYNIAIGVQSGQTLSGTTSGATNSNNSIFIGYDTRPNGSLETNQIVIGHGAVGLGSNTVTLGAASITKTQLRGTINLGSVPIGPSGLVSGDVYQTVGNVLMVVP